MNARKKRLLYLLNSVWDAVQAEAKKENRSGATNMIEMILMERYGIEATDEEESKPQAATKKTTPRAQKSAKRRANGTNDK